MDWTFAKLAKATAEAIVYDYSHEQYADLSGYFKSYAEMKRIESWDTADEKEYIASIMDELTDYQYFFRTDAEYGNTFGFGKYARDSDITYSEFKSLLMKEIKKLESHQAS